MRTRLDREVQRVLRRDACSGCGACTLLDGGLTMADSADGFRRPVRSAPTSLDARADREAVRRFRRSCPGVTVSAAAVADAPRHPLLGPALGTWRAWATDEEVRYRGSSGGVLTALTAWLTATGEASHVVGAAAGPDPRRAVSVRIQSREEALAAAGSRYAPTATAGEPGVLDPGSAVVCKPCEASALRGLGTPGTDDAPGPLVLSFFCAGTPSQHATDRLVTELGLPDDARLSTVRYRGHGWPGRFVARAEDGREVAMSYEESWGRRLGPTVQWRCKICPDGVGESSDIAAGDYWRTDERGYPSFAEDDGASALVARTPRGLDVVRRAVAAGVLAVEPIDPDKVMAVQPFQRRRRTTLLGRLVGTVAAGRPVPRYRGFGLLRLAVGAPRETVSAARGTFGRVRRARRPVTAGRTGPSGSGPDAGHGSGAGPLRVGG